MGSHSDIDLFTGRIFEYMDGTTRGIRSSSFYLNSF